MSAGNLATKRALGETRTPQLRGHQVAGDSLSKYRPQADLTLESEHTPTHGIADEPKPPGEVEGIYVTRFERIAKRLQKCSRFDRHDYFEVFLLEGGGIHFNDFQSFVIREPTLVFVSPGQVHGWEDAKGLHGVGIRFTQEFFDGNTPPPSPLLKHGFWFPDEVRPALHLPESAASEMAALVVDMEREFMDKSAGFDEALRALLRVLFVRADRLSAGATDRMPHCRSSILVRNFRLALEHHFRTLQAVVDYAKLLKVSADHLGQVIHEQTGHQAGDLIRHRILLEAKRLLAHTEMNISEVAYSLNFQDPAYFSRFFRRLTNLSPGEFREVMMPGSF